MRNNNLLDIYKTPKRSAKLAHLKYIEDFDKGFKRIKKEKVFIYLDEKGKVIRNKQHIKRISSLKIPPAWKDVWICPDSNGHLQATGIDTKKRKQYLYHPNWSALREILKYFRLSHFVDVLPKIRKVVELNLKKEGLSREKVISAALSLIDKLHMRIGNEEYKKENDTYGLTTLRDKHVNIKGDTLILEFIGKSQKKHELELKDKKIADTVKETKNLPGYELFQYVDEEHKVHPITSTEVNNFISKITGGDYTAKDFRTWAGTLHAYIEMKRECGESEKIDPKKSLKKVIDCVALELGNTPAVCKAHYVHRDLQDVFCQGNLTLHIENVNRIRKIKGLSKEENELKEILSILYKEKLKKLRI
jgi:DNA topoisomerase I